MLVFILTQTLQFCFDLLINETLSFEIWRKKNCFLALPVYGSAWFDLSSVIINTYMFIDLSNFSFINNFIFYGFILYCFFSQMANWSLVSNSTKNRNKTFTLALINSNQLMNEFVVLSCEFMKSAVYLLLGVSSYCYFK